MEGLTNIARRGANNTRQTSTLAVSTPSITVKSEEVIGHMADTMASVSEGSRETADIIGVVKDVALQTSILTLSVAMETAHAGEQDHGFTVIADEVCSPARYNAVAVKEIGELIGDSVDHV